MNKLVLFTNLTIVSIPHLVDLQHERDVDLRRISKERSDPPRPPKRRWQRWEGEVRGIGDGDDVVMAPSYGERYTSFKKKNGYHYNWLLLQGYRKP